MSPWGSFLLAGALTLAQVALAIDRWVHSRESKAGVTKQVDDALEASRKHAEDLRIERALLVDQRFKEIRSVCAENHDRLNGHGKRLSRHDAQLDVIWGRLNLRQVGRDEA